MNLSLKEAFDKQIKALPNTQKLYFFDKELGNEVQQAPRANYESTLNGYVVVALPSGTTVVPTLARKAGATKLSGRV